MANIYIDNIYVLSVDLYSDETLHMTSVFNEPDLACGPHQFTIELANKKTKNPSNKITLDAFEIMLNN